MKPPKPIAACRGRLAIAIVLSCLIVFTVLVYADDTDSMKVYRIPVGSMENTLMAGDLVAADLRAFVAWQPTYGDLLVFKYPADTSTSHVKRCVGLPGDTILYQDKQLYRNGALVKPPFRARFIDTTADGRQRVLPRGANGENSRDNMGPTIVPAGSYFVMGDSRDNSFDSRFFGPVGAELIIGKVTGYVKANADSTWVEEIDTIPPSW